MREYLLDVAFWHKADKAAAPAFVRYWSNSGHCWILARDALSASDLDIQARPLLGLTASANLLSTADEVIE